MKTSLIAALLAATVAAPAFAEGDAEAGATAFDRQCTSCHIVANAAGDVLAGRNAKTGPNLFGIATAPIGAVEGFRYGDSILAVNATGAVWSEEDFVAYVQDPTEWLRAKLEDPRARSKMSFKVRSEENARNIYAYLATFTE